MSITNLYILSIQLVSFETKVDMTAKRIKRQALEYFVTGSVSEVTSMMEIKEMTREKERKM